MKATFVLLADVEAENFGRKCMQIFALYARMIVQMQGGGRSCSGGYSDGRQRGS